MCSASAWVIDSAVVVLLRLRLFEVGVAEPEEGGATVWDPYRPCGCWQVVRIDRFTGAQRIGSEYSNYLRSSMDLVSDMIDSTARCDCSRAKKGRRCRLHSDQSFALL